MDKKVVTFGEVMMRLSTPGNLRFLQAHSFDVIYGGGECNVAVALANLGVPVDFVTRLPANDLGDACVNFIRQFDVGVTNIVRGGERLGIYFLETGAAQRASKVVYDRANSSLSTVEPRMIDWERILQDASWFHWTGITPAVSQGAALVCLEAVKKAKEMKITVSSDLNYRSKLWKWGKPAGEVMAELVAHCDVAIGNEEDAHKVFGITAPHTDITRAEVSAENYRQVCEKLQEKFPSLKTIMITLRGSLSASHNTWAGTLWHNNEFYTSPTYDVYPIVDRVGGGDSSAAGLIYGLLNFGGDMQRTLNFAVAAACLKHSILGDFNLVSLSEVEKLMAGDASGRVSR
ncbi:MAG: sugar kinase [Phycisphaerae bacterium]|nr:sugar kinase [Phycisphaerae bacterium]